LTQFVDLDGDGFGIGSIAGKNFDRDGASSSVGEEPKDDL